MKLPSAACPGCFARLGADGACHSCTMFINPDVHARATVGAAFVEPSAIGERIVKVVTDMLAKVVDRAVAEERARNVASYMITAFDVKERIR